MPGRKHGSSHGRTTQPKKHNASTAPIVGRQRHKDRGSEKSVFLNKPNPVVFWVLLGFSDFLFEQAVGKLVG